MKDETPEEIKARLARTCPPPAKLEDGKFAGGLGVQEPEPEPKSVSDSAKEVKP